jgi:coenzyme F420 hydrogenase subunit delta
MEPVTYSTMIFGCGNVVMGDDGYGPAVVDMLNSQHTLPKDVQAVDAGTCVREYLFDYLLTDEGRPETIIILDAVDFPDRKPGEVFEIDPSSIPPKKIHDFSLHQFPTVNLLLELEQHTGVRVIILAAQVEYIPAEITPGLTDAMSAAVSVACAKVVQILSEKAK